MIRAHDLFRRSVETFAAGGTLRILIVRLTHPGVIAPPLGIEGSVIDTALIRLVIPVPFRPSAL